MQNDVRSQVTELSPDDKLARHAVDPSRRLFLRRSAVLTLAGGSAALLLNAAATPAFAKRKNKRHNPHGGPNSARDEFESIRRHENDHVAFLVDALGGAARPKPTFQNLEQPDYTHFVTVSQALENTGVGAYLGAAPFINSMEYLAAAGSVAFIEARHAGYLNVLNDDPITAPPGR